MTKLELIYEDNHVLVAVKPPNLPAQADQSGDADMLSHCREYIRVTRKKPGQTYIGLVHRLDRPAAGLMVFALTSKAAGRLCEQMREHQAGRSYLAIVHGVPKSGVLVHYLKESTGKMRSVPENTPGAKRAELNLEVVETFDSPNEGKLTLCVVQLKTGRKHQIRAQLAAQGHALFGDARYDFGRAKPGQQLALWGYKLVFRHPTLQRDMTFFSRPKGQSWTAFEEAIERVVGPVVEKESGGVSERKTFPTSERESGAAIEEKLTPVVETEPAPAIEREESPKAD